MADAYLVAWRRLDHMPQEHGESRAWLFGIARKCLANARRGEQRQDALSVRVAEAAARSGDDGADPDVLALRMDLSAGWRSAAEASAPA